MKPAPPKIVAFDARYIHDRYHGIGRYAYNLLEALTRLDTQRRYLIFSHPGYPNTRFPLENLALRPNVELRSIKLPLYLPSEQLIWPLLLARARVDLFHSPYVVLPLLARVKSVMTIHDLIFERFPAYRPRSYLQRFYLPVTRLSLQHADAVLTLSEATRRDVQDYYRANKTAMCVTGGAIDPIFQRETDATRLTEVRKRYHLPDHFILTIGVGRPHKNVETLVAAFAQIASDFALHLVIGGERDRRFPDGVEACIAAHGLGQRVLQPGSIREADLPAVYTLADIFVFPSLIEGFGFPPLEAMACGTPVLASNTPAVAETVGNAALMFNGRDVQQLAQLLRQVLADEQQALILRQLGRERVQTFTWERVAYKTLDTYNLLESGDAHPHWLAAG